MGTSRDRRKGSPDRRRDDPPGGGGGSGISFVLLTLILAVIGLQVFYENAVNWSEDHSRVWTTSVAIASLGLGGAALLVAVVGRARARIESWGLTVPGWVVVLCLGVGDVVLTLLVPVCSYLVLRPVDPHFTWRHEVWLPAYVVVIFVYVSVLTGLLHRRWRPPGRRAGNGSSTNRGGFLFDSRVEVSEIDPGEKGETIVWMLFPDLEGGKKIDLSRESGRIAIRLASQLLQDRRRGKKPELCGWLSAEELFDPEASDRVKKGELQEPEALNKDEREESGNGAVKMRIKRLRQQLAKAGLPGKDIIENRPGLGYRLSVPPDRVVLHGARSRRGRRFLSRLKGRFRRR